jgi:hypothetical protein
MSKTVDRQETHREVLNLYRRIMRAADDWPSVKKKAVVTEIRHAFRSNAGEQDAQKIEKMIAEAHSGLRELLHNVAQAARLKATPSMPKWIPRESMGSWPDEGPRDAGSHTQRGADKWALDELGLGASATMSQAKSAYHERAKACHPDSGTPSANAEAFKRLQKAWEHVQKALLQAQQGSRFR